MFRIGQKVVCVDASRHEDFPKPKLVKGSIYTITRLYPSPRPSIELGVEVAETISHSGVGFKASRFRPVVERKTDISIFKKMLVPKKEDIDV